MKIIENNLIPFKGFKAINLFGVVFKRKDASPMSEEDINHEAIHTAQMKELLYVPFYIIYLFEFMYKSVTMFSNSVAYMNLSFEKEAYDNQHNLNYLKGRKHYAQWRHSKNN